MKQDKKKSSNTCVFDPCSQQNMAEIMEKYGSSPTSFSGVNVDDEDIEISISSDQITVLTFQKNGWTRRNTYYKNTDETDETYEGKWK